MSADKYPIDIERLTKGQDYDLEAAGVLRTKATSRRRQLELLNICQHVQRMCDAAGMCMSLRVVGDRCIRVMTDDEAARYHDRHAAGAVRKLGQQAFRLRANVDASALTEEGRKEHERAVAHRAMQYLAARAPIGRLRQLHGADLRKIESDERPNPFRRGTA